MEWLYPEKSGSICICIVTAENLENTLNKLAYKPFAVYITNPDYFGGMSDIKEFLTLVKNITSIKY